MSNPPRRPLFRMAAAGLLAALLASCGGGSEEPELCSVEGEKSYLQAYFDEWYLWTAAAPKPAPADHATVDAFFQASLYTAGLPGIPADRWSGYQSADAFARFFGEGRTLGYGIFVSGLEVEGRPDQPLYVRFIEAQSPAQAAGLRRGDEIRAINDQPASELIANNDYAVLTPASEGQVIRVTYRRNGVDATVNLSAQVYALTPVAQRQVMVLPDGRKLGYLVVKDMLTQSEADLAAAFTSFGNAGVQELVLDLRYNGGGLVSAGSHLASHMAASRTAGRTYARLRFNSAKSGSNSTYSFGSPAEALNLNRVYVLTGQRTCSASEQVINALTPFVDVVRVGGTTCGKPVGFQARSYCGTSYSVVNFDSVNASSQGGYYDGFAPTCEASDDTSQPLGDASENLLAAAIGHMQTGQCSALAQGREQAQGRAATRRSTLREPGDVPGMLAR